MGEQYYWQREGFWHECAREYMKVFREHYKATPLQDKHNHAKKEEGYNDGETREGQTKSF